MLPKTQFLWGHHLAQIACEVSAVHWEEEMSFNKFLSAQEVPSSSKEPSQAAVVTFKIANEI